jgi:hypothetical protein
LTGQDEAAVTPLRQHPEQLRAVHKCSAQYSGKICDGIRQGSIQQQVQTHPQRCRQPDLAPRLSVFSTRLRVVTAFCPQNAR